MAEPKFKEAVTINGRDYLTVQDFAKITNRSVASVRQYMSLGNRIRKIKSMRLAGRALIPVTEVYTFPFTMSGRNTEDVYNYRLGEEGVYVIRAKGYCNAPNMCVDPNMDCSNCKHFKLFKNIQEV